jgi:hypothetical protein
VGPTQEIEMNSKNLNFVQTWFTLKVIFLSSNNLDKILCDRFRQEEQLLLLQLSHIQI